MICQHDTYRHLCCGALALLVASVPFDMLPRFRYHLKDVIVGKIYFLLVRIKIKHMELAIIKRETTGSGKRQMYFPVATFKCV